MCPLKVILLIHFNESYILMFLYYTNFIHFFYNCLISNYNKLSLTVRQKITIDEEGFLSEMNENYQNNLYDSNKSKKSTKGKYI